MILATRYNGNHRIEKRFGANTAVAPRYMGMASLAGEIVNGGSASGLAAVGRSVRLVSALVASLPLSVFEGQRATRRERPDSPQAALFRNPVAGMSDYDWRWDVASSLEGVTLTFSAEHFTARSNVPNYDYSNLRLQTLLVKRF